MNLSQQVVSLKLAKKLKELGVKQESYWYWFPGGKLRDWEGAVVPPVTGYSAFTVSELGELLLKFPYPATFHTKWYEGGGVYLDITFSQGFKSSIRFNKTKGNIAQKINKFQIDNLKDLPKSEANARAKMLIYLIENKLIKLK